MAGLVAARLGCMFTILTACYGYEKGSSPSLLYEEGTPLLYLNGSAIRFPHSVVTRVTDLNSDRLADLIIATDGRLYVCLGGPAGRFRPPIPVKNSEGEVDTGMRGDAQTSIAYADIDGDRKADLLITKGTTLFYMKETERSGEIPTFGKMHLLRELDSNRFDVTDWNSDGMGDVITGSFDGFLRVYFNSGEQGKPSLADYHQLPTPIPGAYNPWPKVMDLNGDEVPEILFTNNWGYFHIFIEVNGVYNKLTLKLKNMTPIYVRERYGEHQAMEPVDLNDDGILDFVTSGMKGDVIYYKGINSVAQKQKEIEYIMAQHPKDLDHQMNANVTLHNVLYDTHNFLHKFLMNKVFTESQKNSLRLWYLSHLADHPQYFKRREFTVPGSAQFAGYIWTVVLDSLPDTRADRRLLASITNHTGYAGSLLENFGILMINNDGAPEETVKMINDFLDTKNPLYYSIASIHQKGYLRGVHSRYGSIRKSGVNIFTGADWPENSFPEDCAVCKQQNRSPEILAFLAAVAHEFAHNELDQNLAPAYRKTLYERKFELLKRASKGHVFWKSPVTDGMDLEKTKQHFVQQGWWDGTSDWNQVFANHFQTGEGVTLKKNVIRDISLDYLINNPQEAFATLSNEYFADTKLMLDFAMERMKAGHPSCMDWFILIANYYTLGGSTFPAYVIDGKGNISSFSGTLSRDSRGYVSGFKFDRSLNLPGPSEYRCRLEEGGFVKSCFGIYDFTDN